LTKYSKFYLPHDGHQDRPVRDDLTNAYPIG